jgi:predicted membrane protein
MRKHHPYSWRQIESHRGTISPRLVVGLLVVVLGVLFLVSNLHIFDISSPLHFFWAAAFSAIGIALLIERQTERSWAWGVAWIVAGVWMFAYQLRWVDIGFWHVLVPLIMLAVGAYLVRQAMSERGGDAKNPGNGSSGSAIHGIGVLSGNEQKPMQPIGRAELFAFWGGVKLDLSEAQLVNNTATIHATACMGGIEILAPSDWVVTSRVLPLMGSFIDKRKPATIIPVPEQAKTLIIDGFVMMGGIEIKN